MLDPQKIRIALADTSALAGRFPQVGAIQSILAQLRYLEDVAEGRADDQRLPEIILGVQAAREIEPLDEALADKLHDIAADIRAMTQASA